MMALPRERSSRALDWYIVLGTTHSLNVNVKNIITNANETPGTTMRHSDTPTLRKAVSSLVEASLP